MTELVPSGENKPSRGFFSDDFDNLFEGFFRPMPFSNRQANGNIVPAIDVVEDDKRFTVTAELPGIDQKDIDVSISDGVLTINAERKVEDEEKDDKGRVIRRESRYGQYTRSMRLDSTIDVKKVKATHKNGILKLVLPKSEKAKTKKIDIDVS